MPFLSALGLVLFLWGVVTLVRRIAESEQQRQDRMGGRPEAWRQSLGATGPAPPAPDAERRALPGTGRPRASDDINWDELQRAEDEVRDLGSDARPEDGWEGDDWGPGAPRKPPLV